MRIVGSIGILATLAMMAVCGYFNWAYQQTLGHGRDAAIALGAGAVLVDLFKGIFPLGVMRAWDEGQYGRMVLPSLGLAFCLCCSIYSEFGFLSLNRGAFVSDRETVTLQFQSASRDLAEADMKRRALGSVRPVPVIEQALRGQRIDRFWTASNHCTDASTAAERQFCKTFFATTSELAASVESARLGTKIDGLQVEIVRLKKAGGGADSDPQAKFLTTLMPWFALDQIALGLNALFPITFEFVAAFGLAASLRLMQPRAASASVIQKAVPFRTTQQIPLQPMRFGRDGDGSIIIDE